MARLGLRLQRDRVRFDASGQVSLDVFRWRPRLKEPPVRREQIMISGLAPTSICRSATMQPMPARPRAHQLEEDSRNTFQGFLPLSWTFSPLRDYGLDGQVEIFTRAGDRTGLLFGVQLKATDATVTIRPLPVRLSQTVISYYRSLPIPVLLCRFHARTGQMFVRWFHSFSVTPTAARRSTAFSHRLSDEWTTATPDAIEAELKLFRDLRSPSTAGPIRLGVTYTMPHVTDRDAKLLDSELRRQAGLVPDIIRLAEVATAHAYPRIILAADRDVVDLAGLSSFTLHRTSPSSSSEPVDSRIRDILVALAVCVGRLGQVVPASRLLVRFAAQSRLLDDPRVITNVTRILLAAGRVDYALTLAEKSLSRHPERSSILRLVAFIGPPLSSDERRRLQRLLRREIALWRRRRAREPEATAWYNLGNHYRSCRRFRLAIRCYQRAIRLGPSYRRRPYIWRELGGSNFGLAKFTASARCYAKAISLGAPRDTIGLHADALLFGGYYESAYGAFRRFLGRAQGQHSEWRLKVLALRHITRKLGLSRQSRRTGRARRAAGRVIGSDSDQLLRRLESALRYDALCSRAWFMLGVVHRRLGANAKAGFHFMVSGLCDPGSVTAWANATALAVSEGDHVFAVHIISAAYYLNGERFYAELLKRMKPNGTTPTRSISALRALMDAVPREADSFTLRTFSSPDHYTEMEFPKV